MHGRSCDWILVGKVKGEHVIEFKPKEIKGWVCYWIPTRGNKRRGPFGEGAQGKFLFPWYFLYWFVLIRKRECEYGGRLLWRL